jgi:transposase
MQAQSGNIHDVEGFKKIVKTYVSSLKAAQQCRYLVADAALYVKEPSFNSMHWVNYLLPACSKNLKKQRSKDTDTKCKFSDICPHL